MSAAKKKSKKQSDRRSRKPEASTPESRDSGLPDDEPLTPELVEDEAIRGDFVLRWSVVLLAILMACTFIAETQTLVHIKSGQFIAGNGFLPSSTDPFSYTTGDQQWVNLSWLFDLIVAGVYAIGGAIGLTVFKAILAGVIFWFLLNLATGKTSTWGTTVAAAVALLACHTSLTVRPELITLLGLSSTFWIINTWKENGPPRRIWALVPVILLWSNLDPHMFLGLTAIVLYGFGDLIGVLWGKPVLTDEQRKPFQLVVACCLLAALVNPFGWQSLLAPFSLYGSEYPAVRELLGDQAPNITTVRFLSLVDSRVWSLLGHAGVAAISLWLAAIVTFMLNFKHLNLSHLLVFLGFSAFAIAGAEQLPAAALVFAVLAALNGRAWYQANFKQVYTVNPGELMFSRGGRAVTVVALFVLAFMAGTGWLRPPGGGTTGFGFDYMLQQSMDALAEQTEESPYDRAFNFSARQGDMLIWVGQKPFIDLRLPLYVKGGDDNLLQKHQRMRESLRIQHVTLSDDQAKTMLVKPDDWKAVFDEYDISHAVLRLTATPEPDYQTLQAFNFSPDDWEMTSLTGAAAVFYRKDATDEERTKFIEEQRYDFVAKAFQEDGPKIDPRVDWVQPPSWYERKLWKLKRQVPEPIQQARHLNRLLQARFALAAQRPLEDVAAYPAMAWLAIQQAHKGLDEDPRSADGYVQLGDAYRFLAQWHQSQLVGRPLWHGVGTRFYQALAAYNQAIVADPENSLAHSRLFEFYNSQTFGRFDLALRELTALQSILQKKRDASEAEQAQLAEMMNISQRIQQHVDQVRAQIEQATANGADPLQQAQLASQQFRCPLLALERLELRPDFVAQNPSAQLLQLNLLLEVGRIQEAYELAGQVEKLMANQSRLNWRMPVAVAYLANAEFERARKLWEMQQDDMELSSATQLLNSMNPKILDDSAFTWPMSATTAAYQYAVSRTAKLAGVNLDIAFALLESGKTGEAAELMQQTLTDAPNSSARNMIAFYLPKMTGDYVDPVVPLNRVPVIFADEPGAEPQTQETPQPEVKDAPAEN